MAVKGSSLLQYMEAKPTKEGIYLYKSGVIYTFIILSKCSFLIVAAVRSTRAISVPRARNRKAKLGDRATSTPDHHSPTMMGALIDVSHHILLRSQRFCHHVRS